MAAAVQLSAGVHTAAAAALLAQRKEPSHVAAAPAPRQLTSRPAFLGRPVQLPAGSSSRPHRRSTVQAFAKPPGGKSPAPPPRTLKWPHEHLGLEWEDLDPLGVRNHLPPLKWPHEHLGLTWADLDPLNVRDLVKRPVQWPHQKWRTEWLDNWTPPPLTAEVRPEEGVLPSWVDLAELPPVGDIAVEPPPTQNQRVPGAGWLPRKKYTWIGASSQVAKKCPKLNPPSLGPPSLAPPAEGASSSQLRLPPGTTLKGADSWRLKDVAPAATPVSKTSTPPLKLPTPRLAPVKWPKVPPPVYWPPLGVPPVVAPPPSTVPERGARQPNPYLMGNFRPVEKEQSEEIECAVIGRIPEGFPEGRFLRNGPNPQFAPDNSRYHWFDGDGMVHSLRFRGRGHPPSYSNHYVRTLKWEAERKAKRALFVGVSMDPIGRYLAVEVLRNLRRGSWADADTPMWSMVKNAGNVSLVAHAGRLLAAWEAGFPYALDPTTLTTQGPYTFDKGLVSPFTAHPKVDPITGEMMYFGYSVMRQPYLHYGVVDRGGAIAHTAGIELPNPVMIHDCGITEHYTLLLDCPLLFFPKRIMEKGKPFVFDASFPTRIGVIPRYGKQEDIQWFEIDTCYIAHVMNAFEEVAVDPLTQQARTTVVLRGMRYSAFSALGLADVAGRGGPATEEVCRLHEWRLDLSTGHVAERRLCEVCSDFPAVHPGLVRASHRFGYSARFASQPGPGTSPPLFDGLLKHDFELGTKAAYSFGAGQFGGEFLFVPRKSDTPMRATAPSEDEGWLVGHVYSEEEQKSEVVIVDCREFGTEPVASIVLPERVPFGFHGTFVEEEEGDT